MNTKGKKNITILAVVVAFVLIIAMVAQFVLIGVETAKTTKLENTIASLKEQIKNAEDEIEYRQTIAYIEKFARENLDLFGEGDIIFVPEG